MGGGEGEGRKRRRRGVGHVYTCVGVHVCVAIGCVNVWVGAKIKREKLCNENIKSSVEPRTLS